ncbi:MAG: AarF/UbiB family protein [Gemmatimonadetes bacterium]|nr:AarF/UbiB family protein [Gemmatimonadota bacterium]
MRALQILLRLAPFVVAFLIDRRRFILFGRPARRTEAQHQRRAKRLTRTLAELGPTFIKLGQVMGIRADIVPEPYLSAMATLSDQVPPLAPGEAERVIAAAEGQTVDELFEEFDPEPLAAASLGQVHRARYQGQDVVVKVLRPGVDDLVQRDLKISFRVLFALHVLFPNHHVRALAAIVNEFAKRINEELDFEEEARHAEALRRNFADEPRVVVPRVFEDLTRRQVLVLEYMSGTRIDRLQDRIASGEVRLDDLIATISELYIRMMLVDGVFHADPHPGNVLLDQQGRIVFLDFGMVLEVEQETRTRLMKTVVAAVRQDADGVINGFYELGILDPDVDRGTVRDAARHLMAVAHREDMSSRQIQHIVEDVLRTFYQWPLILPSDLVYFGRAAVLVEGIGHHYDPEFNAMAAIRPVVTRMSPQLTKTLLGVSPEHSLLDWSQEAASTVRTLKDLLTRIEREELRIRWHPRDILEMQRFLAQQVRRGLLAVFAFTVALISSIVYLAVHRLEVLVIGLLLSLGMFLVVFVLPSHLFQNPLRLRPRWPMGR